ncbi:MAG: alanine--tRNA ligase-related protein, partial [Chloroflexota bacterium]
MTQLLYQTDSYLKEFQAVVSSIDAELHGVELDQTAFYPGGGGQPADVGTLTANNETYSVVKFKRANGKLYHI